MPSRSSLAVALPLVALMSACTPRPDPIVVHDRVISIENQTGQEWRNVIVTVNDHFRGGTPVLRPGARLDAPLTQFQTGLGQRFDLSRQKVFKIEVVATDARDQPVALQWGTSKR